MNEWVNEWTSPLLAMMTHMLKKRKRIDIFSFLLSSAIGYSNFKDLAVSPTSLHYGPFSTLQKFSIPSAEMTS